MNENSNPSNGKEDRESDSDRGTTQNGTNQSRRERRRKRNSDVDQSSENSDNEQISARPTETSGTDKVPKPDAVSAVITPADAVARDTVMPSDPERVSEIRSGSRYTTERPRRKRWFSDLPDRGLFILFLVAGVVAVFFLKLGPFDPSTAKWYAAGAASAALILYAGIAQRLDHYQLRGDRLGDNCYYLGFLLTLASMAAALIQFDLSSENRGEVLERLIGSFGIALFSTFVGIALRVAFLQMRREVDDLEEQIRQDLQERANSLKSQLLMAVSELESFRLRTRQVLDERLIETTDLFATQSKDQIERIVALAQQVADEGSRTLQTHTKQAMALEEAIRAQTAAAANLAERLGKIDVPPDLFRVEIVRLAERLAEIAGPFQASATDFSERIRAIDIPVDLVATRLVPFTEAIERATASVDRLANAELERRNALDEATANAARAIQEATRVLTERPKGFFSRFAYIIGLRR
jgi:hypothetical protein